MSIEKIKTGINRLKDEVPGISDAEGLEAVDYIFESVLLQVERLSQQASRGVDSLYHDVAIASAIRGQIALGLARNSRE